MNRFFSYHKKDRPSFEIKEDRLEQIEMPDMPNDSVGLVDDSQTGYDDPRWIEKSNSIKAHDNYTCQLCHAFNPQLGNFVFVKQGEYDTIHHYYWVGNSIYTIHVIGYVLEITFSFSFGFHLAMPRLNVHHKIYYRNRDLWDYPNDCLVTLCEDCRHYIHSLSDIGIPIVEENADGQNILIGKTRPKPYHQELDHTDLGTFSPLALVKKNRTGLGLKGKDLEDFKRAQKDNKHWYDYYEILDDKVVHITYFVAEVPKSGHTLEETEIVADFIIKDFLENILGFWQTKTVL